MSDTTIKAYQVIDEDLEFHSANLEEALSTPNTQRPLYCSIIGSQSSGKSSILNQIAGQSLFNVMDLSSWKEFPRELTKGDLERICNDYADMVVRHKSLPKLSRQPLVRKEIVMPESTPS